MDSRFKPTPAPGKQAGPTPAELLAKIPRRPMNADQQAAALEKVQQQATQRVKLGQQLFEAADARLKQHQKVLDEINDQQQKLREQVQEDVAKSLQSYDQWMGKIDESFTTAISDLNQRLDQLESKVEGSQDDMQKMIENAAALLEQTQDLLADAFGDDVLPTEPTEPTEQAADSHPLLQQPQPPIQPPIQESFEGGGIAEEMQASIPQDQQFDIEDLPRPSAYDDDDDDEVIEVEVVDSIDPAPQDTANQYQASAGSDDDDVFGEVLRRLRSQNDGDEDHAAA